MSMTESPERNDQNRGLRGLSDPELLARWAAARMRLCCIPRDSPDRGQAKRLYDDMAAEYRRRLDGDPA